MEIKIVFEIEEGSKQVIGDFSRALTGLGKTTVPETILVKATTPEAVKVFEKIKEAKEEIETPREVETPRPQNSAPVGTQAPATPTETAVPTSATPTWSLDQLRAGCADASSLGKSAELANLIRGKYGVGKLDFLPVESYDSFAEDLRALGVRI